MNDLGEKRYIIVQKQGEKHKIACESDSEASKIKDSLIEEMSNSVKRQYVYSNFKRHKKRYGQVNLSFIRYKIDSRLTTLKTIDEAVKNRYQTVKPAELNQLVEHLSSFSIAYKYKGQIMFLDLLKPGEFDYVKDAESLYEKLLPLLENPQFNIFKFCRQNKIDSMKDMRDDLYEMLLSYNKIPENGKTDFKSGVYNLILQLHSGDGKTIQYKRFRTFGISLKEEVDRLNKIQEENQKLEDTLKDLESLNVLFDPKSKPEEPFQLKMEL